MAVRVLNLSIKIALLVAVMLIVVKVVPYGEVVNEVVIKYLSVDRSEAISKVLIGESEPEPQESIVFFIFFAINLLISVPVLSVIITVFNVIVNNISLTELPMKIVLSTLRRYIKVFVFTFLFWGFFRFIPYEMLLTNNQKYSMAIMALVIGVNLFITLISYGAITNKLINKRKL